MITAVDVEVEIRRLADSGDTAAAATRVIESYGGEVLGFLVNVLGSQQDAEDAFSQACEDLWSGFSRFEWRCAQRTWFYVLARHAAARLKRSPHQRAERRVPISQISDAAARVRTRTAPHLQTQVKDAFAAIRDSLSPDDRALLVLRVDRGMEWSEVARVIHADEAGRSEKDLARAAARLRKRYQTVKNDIREKALAAGILSLAEG